MPKRRQIPNLFAQKQASGRTYYYWKPSPRLRRLGWSNQSLGPDQAEASKQAIALNEQVQAAVGEPTKRRRRRGITMGEVIDAFKKHTEFTRLRPKTKQDYIYRLKQIRAWTLAGKMRVEDLSAKSVRDWVEAGLQKSSPSVVASKLRVLRLLLSWAIREEIIKDYNPASKVKMPKVDRRKVYRDWPTIERVAIQADLSGCPYTGPGLRYGFWTMQRQADLLSLTRFHWKEIYDVDPRDRDILCGPNGKVMGFHLFEGQQKTDQPVVCPMPPFLHAEIETRFDQSQFLFPMASDPLRRVSQDVFGRSVNSKMRELGLIGVIHKDMRRSGMSWQRAMGNSPAKIRAISGHVTPDAEKMDEVYMPRSIRDGCETIATTLRAMKARTNLGASDVRED